jgi:hypothetical protein
VPSFTPKYVIHTQYLDSFTPSTLTPSAFLHAQVLALHICRHVHMIVAMVICPRVTRLLSIREIGTLYNDFAVRVKSRSSVCL